MARIPVGNFGTMIASPAPSVRLPAAAFDDGSGAGLRQLGDSVMHAAKVQLNEERQQQDALLRAKAANALLDHEIAVKSVSDGIAQELSDGRLSYRDAESAYRERLGSIEKPSTEGYDPVTLENFSKGIKRAEFGGANHLAGAIKTARIGEAKSTTESLLDKLGKQAGLPGADVGALNQQIDGLDDVGRQAYGAAWDKRKQDWRDNNWNDHLNQRAMAARNDLQGLQKLQEEITSGAYADKLDSNRRNTLVGRLDGYRTSLIQRQEAAAARAERAAERHMKKAEAEFNTFQTLADKGTILDPGYIDAAMQKTAGTPYQKGVIELARQAQETGGMASKPIRAQQAELDAIDRQIAAGGRNPALDKRREQLAKVLHASESDLKQDGLRAGLERGVIPSLAPIDVSTPEAFAKSIAGRVDQAETVGLWAGKAVSPLDANEAESVRSMLESLPPKPRAEAIATIAGAVGPRSAAAIAEQLDGKDRPTALAFAAAGAQTTSNRFTSELILKGAAGIKDGTVMKDDKKVTGWKSQIAAELEGALPNEKAAAAVRDAAYYIAAGIAHENGGSVSPSEIKRAVRLALDGSIIERGGKKLPIPAGLDADDFDKRLRSVPADAITRQAPDGKVRVAGAEMDAAAFAASIPGQELVFAGPNRYAVVVRGRPVVNTAGRPIFVEVR